MNTPEPTRLNRKQIIFKDLARGTLLWACVLRFFNDYSDIVYARSFSYLFLAATVLAILVILTLTAKKRALSSFNKQNTLLDNVPAILGTWLILFLSKFVFIGVIDILFAGTVTIYGFFNIAIVVLIATVVQRLAEYVFIQLGDT